MKRTVTVLFAILLIGCGNNNPADSGGRSIVSDKFSVDLNTYRTFTFTIDTDIEQNAYIQGQFTVTGGSVEFAIMNEANFQSWQSGGTPTVLYSPGLTPSDSFGRLDITESGTYYLVFKNTQASSAVTVDAKYTLYSAKETTTAG